MDQPRFILALVVILAQLFLISFTNAQNLTFVECIARLPTKRGSVASLYDGNDTIYLFGGTGWVEPGNDSYTLKYSISRDAIEPTKEQLPFGSYGGRIIMDQHKNIYYLVGNSSRSLNLDIYQYFPEKGSFVSVAGLPSRNKNFAVLVPDSDTAWILGGKRDTNGVVSLDLNTLKTQRIAELPKKGYERGISAIWIEEKEIAYIFDGEYQFENVTKYERSTNQFHILPNYFPPMWGMAEAVWDGRYGYIIGGILEFGEKSKSILQFDPETEDVKFIPVEGYPGGEDYFGETSAVYVGKLNRIYMFGGYRQTNSMSDYFDKIWYISLDNLSQPNTTTATTISTTTTTANTPIPTLDPEVFNCVGLGETVHPYPGDCKRFVVCRDDHSYEFPCPVPLLFHATNLKCMWPDYVDCAVVESTTLVMKEA